MSVKILKAYKFQGYERDISVEASYRASNGEMDIVEIIERGEVPKVIKLSPSGFKDMQEALNLIAPPQRKLDEKERRTALDIMISTKQLLGYMQGRANDPLSSTTLFGINMPKVGELMEQVNRAIDMLRKEQGNE